MYGIAVLPFNRKEEDNRRARNMPVEKAPKKPHGALRKKEGFTPSRRKPLCCLMPETGLEPALPLQEPGPQPGASANSATPAGCSYYERSLRANQGRDAHHFMVPTAVTTGNLA